MPVRFSVAGSFDSIVSTPGKICDGSGEWKENECFVSSWKCNDGIAHTVRPGTWQPTGFSTNRLAWWGPGGCLGVVCFCLLSSYHFVLDDGFREFVDVSHYCCRGAILSIEGCILPLTGSWLLFVFPNTPASLCPFPRGWWSSLSTAFCISLKPLRRRDLSVVDQNSGRGTLCSMFCFDPSVHIYWYDILRSYTTRSYTILQSSMLLISILDYF